MKTAISLPDDLFDRAQRLARRQHKSRSQLYQDAMSEYLGRHDAAADDVTRMMDEAIARVSPPIDSFVAAASQRVLENSEW